MRVYADEDFPLPVVEELRRIGHDVLTAQEDGRQTAPDIDILARAHLLSRAVLTHNRRHFERIHREGYAHSGILSATWDGDPRPAADRPRAHGRAPWGTSAGRRSSKPQAH